MNYLIGIAAFLAIAIAIEQFGEHRIKVQWEQDKAVRQALIDEATKRNEQTIKDLEAQHAKDIQLATSKAGHDAVNNWLKSHRLLPNGSTVPANAGTVPGQSPKISDGSACQCGTGDGITEFAASCATDALKVLDWQDWAKRAGVVVE